MKQHIFLYSTCILALLLALSCSENADNPGPEGYENGLKNDCLKRSIGPNVVGLDMAFVYAIALPREAGKILSAKVEASIPGASGTFLEHRSFYTDASGADIPVTVGNPGLTSGAKSEVTFTADTCAASLRYFYKVPAEAKGKSIEFNFSATASNGQTVNYKLGPYEVSNVDMALDLVATDGDKCYISITDLAVYNATEAAANSAKIDLVYLYRSDITSFAHALVAPAADATYRPGISLPAGVSNNSPIRRVYQVRDKHLARLQYGVYVDDADFVALDFAGMPNFSLNLLNEYGLFVETQDGKYRAYIYVNAVNPGTSNSGIPANSMKISIKRYTVK
jgi:hypothetical protein